MIFYNFEGTRIKPRISFTSSISSIKVSFQKLDSSFSARVISIQLTISENFPF